jgi:8-oxo-dGTP pyrophosphatase MutT (NUDIX family)
VEKKLVYPGYFQVYEVKTPDGWRMRIEATNAINVLLVDMAKRRIILARQPRVNMMTDENPTGLITETIAGRFDVDLTPKQLAVKEAQEEAGVTITPDQVEMLNDGMPMAISAGSITEKVFLAVCYLKPGQMEEVEREFSAEGEHEHIRRVYLDFDELEQYVCEDTRVFALKQYLLRWLEKNS